MAFRRNSKGHDEIPLPRQQHPPNHDPYLAHSHDESNWLISYADMMTLLCGFFIMLFSLSKIDDRKYNAVKQEIAKSFGGTVAEAPSRQMEQVIKQVVEDAGMRGNTVIHSDPTSVTVAFQSALFFDTLSAEVKPEGAMVLQRLILAISSREQTEKKQYRIVVEGHTDSRPILGGVFPSNWELSGARASRVVRMFLERGFSPDHLTAIGFGDTRPEVASRTPAGVWDEEALSKNRRVVLRVLDPSVDSVSIAPTVPATATDPSKI